jgi:hypothetical protein
MSFLTFLQPKSNAGRIPPAENRLSQDRRGLPVFAGKHSSHIAESVGEFLITFSAAADQIAYLALSSQS